VTTTARTAGRAAAGADRSRRRRLAVACLAALALLAVAPALPASAHAVLTGSTPTDGEALGGAPTEVRLSFNEPVVVREGALRVYDGDAQRVDTGSVPTDDDTEVVVGLPADLPEAAYVATYRIVSADSHPIAGTITFTVGDTAALDAATIERIAGPGTGPIGTVGSVLRGIGYVGTLLAAGAVIFAVVVARGPGDRRRAARAGRVGALVGAGAVLLHLPVQAAAVSGFGLVTAVTDLGVMGGTLTSGFGQSWLARLVALLALAVPWFAEADRPGPADAAGPSARGTRGGGSPLAWLGLAAALALGSFLLDGHQRTVEPTWLLVAGDAVHLVGAAAWFGGLVLVSLTVRRTRLDDDPVGAATVVARFSRLALWSVVALTVTGTAMSLPLVRTVDAVTSTTYGWILLAKVGVAGAVVAIAAYNRRQLVPAIATLAVPAGGSAGASPPETTETTTATTPETAAGPDARADAWAALGRTVRAEALLLVVVLGLTGFLVTTQPAAEAAGVTGPTMLSAPLTDEFRLDLIVTPSAVGLNTIHVFAVEPSGQPTGEVDELRLEFTYLDEGIGPFVVEPYAAGPGHWTASIEDLRFAGDWEVRVVAGLGFDEAEVTLPFTLH
jgi:copper transport protein